LGRALKRSGYPLQSFIPLRFIKGFPLLSLTQKSGSNN
jgi:hypothetical protein